jgi:hypothetical protein
MSTYNLVPNVVKLSNDSGAGFYVKLPGPAPALQKNTSQNFSNLVSGNGSAYAFYVDNSDNLNLQELGSSNSWVLGSYPSPYQACMWDNTICYCDGSGNLYQITFDSEGNPTVGSFTALNQGPVMLAGNASLWALAVGGTQLYQLTADGWSQISQPNIPTSGITCFSTVYPFVMAGSFGGSICILDESKGKFSAPMYQATQEINNLCGMAVQLNDPVQSATAYSVSLWFTSGSNGLAGIIYQSGNGSSSPSATSYTGIQPALDISWLAFSSTSGLLYTLELGQPSTLGSFDPVVGAWLYVSSGNQKVTVFANQHSLVETTATTFNFSTGPNGTGNTGSYQIYINNQISSSVTIGGGMPNVTVNQSVWNLASPNVQLPIRWIYFPVNIGLKLHVGGGWVISEVDMDPINSVQ